MSRYSSDVLDLSRLAPPAAIEALSFAVLFAGFQTRFSAFWEAACLKDPTLPAYDVGTLETDPVVIVNQAWSYLRLLDRARVNDAIRAVLAPFALGTDLDAVVASANVERLVLVPATDTEPAIMERDADLLRRYMLSFTRPAAGSRDGYLYRAWTAWPGMGDVAVLGYAVHGQRGDIHIVISGPDGRLPTEAERAAVSAALRHPAVKPEAVALSILSVQRAEYAVSLRITIPAGPDGTLVAAEVEARILAATATRTLIGGEVPPGFIVGAAYGANVIAVEDLAPVVIAPDPYKVPACTGIAVEFVVRS